ncbi:tandem C2 domains nuclear protein [Syngnathus acus]|uniref:tandem C2 domains nuclear protein n=1 Tax=Syngnathus acus TaxID=161584 RepID=UPI001885DE81|nr:tandem C2 domains nuclear protein [Syngnathus acus]
MECIKNCCKRFSKKQGKEPEPEPEETEDIAVQLPVTSKRWGVQEDYLLSKMPPGGREVPFVLPTLKASYVQPGASTFPNLDYGMPGPARCTYAQRKAELVTPVAYNADAGERLSQSMSELNNLHSPQMKSYDSMSSVLSTPTSTTDSIKRSTESFSLFGDDLGSLCVRLSYQEEMEQVWITLVQCSQLNLTTNDAKKPKIQIKGVITLPKPVKFQTSIKQYSQDTSFMETFVFALSLQSLRCSALQLKLQKQGGKKRTVAECVLSLRSLGPQETEHWLPLKVPCKSPGRGCELHLATCFQPVCRRMQVRVLAAQNLPASSSPLLPAYTVTVEMYGASGPLTKKKTRALKTTRGQCQWDDTFYLDLDALDAAACTLSVKLFSCCSIKRKNCIGQVHLGLDGPTREAAEHWKDTVEHPEKVVEAWHTVT